MSDIRPHTCTHLLYILVCASNHVLECKHMHTLSGLLCLRLFLLATTSFSFTLCSIKEGQCPFLPCCKILHCVTMVTAGPQLVSQSPQNGKSSATQSPQWMLLQHTFLPGQNYISCRLTCSLSIARGKSWRSDTNTLKHKCTRQSLGDLHTATWQLFVNSYWINLALSAYHTGSWKFCNIYDLIMI